MNGYEIGVTHRSAELRSLALHRIIARRVVEDPSVLDRARRKVQSWDAPDSIVDSARAARWAALLDGPGDELLELIVADTPEAVDLRQVTPFAGVVDSRERWDMLRRVG